MSTMIKKRASKKGLGTCCERLTIARYKEHCYFQGVI